MCEEAKPDAVRSPHDLLDVAPGQLLRARHGRGRTSQLGAHLPRNQGINFRPVVLVVTPGTRKPEPALNQESSAQDHRRWNR
jgi:hypothetical protein